MYLRKLISAPTINLRKCTTTTHSAHQMGRNNACSSSLVSQQTLEMSPRVSVKYLEQQLLDLCEKRIIYTYIFCFFVHMRQFDSPIISKEKCLLANFSYFVRLKNTKSRSKKEAKPYNFLITKNVHNMQAVHKLQKQLKRHPLTPVFPSSDLCSHSFNRFQF